MTTDLGRGAAMTAALDHAFEFYNERLFERTLDKPVLILHRKRGANGYYWHDVWADRDGSARVPEIAINPDEILTRDIENVLATLVHEMVHLWQYHFGKPSRGYHNKEWAAKMREVGLEGDNGRGGDTGYKCATRIVDDGPFARATECLLASGWTLAAGATPEGIITKPKRQSQLKVKYVCPFCDSKVWGKPGLLIQCYDCQELYEEVN